MYVRIIFLMNYNINETLKMLSETIITLMLSSNLPICSKNKLEFANIGLHNALDVHSYTHCKSESVIVAKCYSTLDRPP